MDVNDTVGGGEIVEALGKTWTLQHVGPGVRAKFSAWCKLRARQSLIEQKGSLDADNYREQLALINDQIISGHYDWGTPLNPKGIGEGIVAMLNSLDGQLYLVGLLLEKAHKDITPDQVLEIMKSSHEQISIALKACLGVPNSDPNE